MSREENRGLTEREKFISLAHLFLAQKDAAISETSLVVVRRKIPAGSWQGTISAATYLDANVIWPKLGFKIRFP